MAGVPGKGGVKGRSGPKITTPYGKLVKHTVLVPADTKAAMTEAGPAAVRDVLIPAFSKDGQ